MRLVKLGDSKARTREILGLPPGPELQARQQWVAAVRLHAADRARWRAARACR